MSCGFDTYLRPAIITLRPERAKGHDGGSEDRKTERTGQKAPLS